MREWIGFSPQGLHSVVTSAWGVLARSLAALSCENFWSAPIIGGTCQYQTSRRPWIRTFPRGAFGTSARRGSILYKRDASSMAQLFVACTEPRPDRGNCLTTLDTYEVLRSRRAIRTVVGVPNRNQSQLSPATCFRKQSIMFVDKGTICGNIAEIL